MWVEISNSIYRSDLLLPIKLRLIKYFISNNFFFIRISHHCHVGEERPKGNFDAQKGEGRKHRREDRKGIRIDKSLNTKGITD